MLVKGIKNASVDELKAENPSLYESVLSLGRSEKDEEIKTLQTQIDTLKREAVIRKSALAMGLTSKGEELIAKGASFEEALVELSSTPKPVEKVEDKSNELKGVLEKTAPKAAGQDSIEDKKEIKTQEDAIKACMTDFNIGRKDAIRKARREYSHLFNNHGGE